MSSHPSRLRGRRPLTPRRLRAWFQAAVIAALALALWELFEFTRWLENAPALAPSLPAPAPPAPPSLPPLSEAFLPGQALVAFRAWLAGYGFDPVHPAGLTIFLAALGMALLARRGFCAYFCPLGYLCEGLNGLGRRLGLSGRSAGMGRRGGLGRPGKLTSALISLPKYLLLALILWLIFIRTAPADLAAWLVGPANKTAAPDLLLYFLEPSSGLLVALGLILLGSVLVPGFWCRGFCPYGALLGLVSLLSPLAIWRDKEKCNYCRRCTNRCPARIPLHEVRRVNGPECRGCLNCLSACPEEDCLTLRAGYGKSARRLPFWVAPLLCALIMGAAWLWAMSGGHWQSRVPAEEIRLYFQTWPLLPK